MLLDKIFTINDSKAFENVALQIFNYQYENCTLYHDWINARRINVNSVSHVHQIPFLPIEFFKSNKIIDRNYSAEIVFKSSGTTASTVSKHYVSAVQLYEKSFVESFTKNYGNPCEYCFLALLPSYLEREGSSLIYMMQHFITKSKYPQSGFFLYNYTDLLEQLKQCIQQKIPTILIGVSFALLDFAENNTIDLSQLIIMETGGMKGRRKEMTREELHEILKKRFNAEHIHSEYGMTELLSQAYSKGNGIFTTTPWMKIFISDIYEPNKILPLGERGIINIIDLANIHSCAFIATNDVGILHSENTFEVLGRSDNSDIRGCNLLIS